MDEKLFNAENIKQLNYALSLFPELEFATFAACYAKDKLKFPVTDLKKLEGLFKNFKSLPQKIQNWGGNMETVKEYFPTNLLPIVDEEDFLSKVLLTMVAGNLKHLNDEYND